jgi:hypothetical protein
MWALLPLLLALLALAGSSAAPLDFDVIVYGATPAGVLAATAAAAEGARVALLEPRGLVGGAISGGLCTTDTGTTTAVLGGRTRQFFQQAAAHYHHPAGTSLYSFEPHVAEGIFQEYFLAPQRPRLQLLLNARIASLALSGARITGALLANGSALTAAVFIDASYEGWLLPMAAVDFTWGREANTTLGERAAGVLPPLNPTWSPAHPYVAQHQLHPPVRPASAATPLLTPPAPAPVGAGERTTMQAYAFRTTLTTNASNMLQPWPRPLDYDPARFELVRAAIAQGNLTQFQDIVGLGGALPNEKYDNNNHGFGQFPGLSWPYPAAVAAQDWAAQEAVWDAHRSAYLGLFYFLATDPALPPGFAEGSRRIGLPLDEHTASGHFPGALYVREALRLQGDYIFTQQSCEGGERHADSIGMGSYSIDIMHHTRFLDPDSGLAVEEGGMQAPSFLNASVAPFEVSYRALVAKRGQGVNLLVPVALSSSHIGFNAVRLEPTWMVLGESAGVAAAQLARNASAGASVQDLDVGVLVQRLAELGQVLTLA